MAQQVLCSFIPMVLQVVGGLFMIGIVGLAIWTFVGIWRHED